MKYDSFSDFKYFIVGASISSGRVFWTGGYGTNKGLSSSGAGVSIRTTSNDRVAVVKHSG